MSALEISGTEARMLGHYRLVERLMDGGISRLTAERLAELELGAAEPGRARSHSHARR